MDFNDPAVWDDSALVDSWNQALEEYKKYHSIHATGGSVEEILAAEKSKEKEAANAKIKIEQDASNNDGDEAMEEGEAAEEVTAAAAAPNGAQQRPPISQSQAPESAPKDVNSGPSVSAGGAFPQPQMLLGSIQDEELKRLLMSWYYAGYYTGLMEGRQKALNEQKQ